MLQYNVSGRSLAQSRNIVRVLKTKYRRWMHIGEIQSVFGFALGFVPLYGGRPYKEDNVIDELQVEQLYDAGINVELTLSNYHFTEKLYRDSTWLLERLERPGNATVVVNDDLARRIKQDFPQYDVRASGIKRLGSHKSINRALEVYDSVTLPPWIIDRGGEFLQKLDDKDRIVIFGVLGCGYQCRERTPDRCYSRCSDHNVSGGKQPLHPPSCRTSGRIENYIKYKELDLTAPMFAGFTRFKSIQGVSGRSEAISLPIFTPGAPPWEQHHDLHVAATEAARSGAKDSDETHALAESSASTQ